MLEGYENKDFFLLLSMPVTRSRSGEKAVTLILILYIYYYLTTFMLIVLPQVQY